MYEVLDKDTIKSEILPHLSVAKRGYVSKSDLAEVIQCLLYKLKTGCKRHMIPVSTIYGGTVLHGKTMYAQLYLIGLIRCYLAGRHELYRVYGNSFQENKKERKVKMTSLTCQFVNSSTCHLVNY